MGCGNLLNEQQNTCGIIEVACGHSSDGAYAPEVTIFVCSGLANSRARYAARKGLIPLGWATATKAVVIAPELIVKASCGVIQGKNSPSSPAAGPDRGLNQKKMTRMHDYAAITIERKYNRRASSASKHQAPRGSMYNLALCSKLTP